MRLALSLLLILGIVPFPGTLAAQGETLSVFVSVLPQKYFVERVGGQHVRVSVVVGPGQSPHTYEPTPKQMVALAGADLYFRVGISFEDVWLGRIAAANPAMRIVDVRTGITLRELGTLTSGHERWQAEAGEIRPRRFDPHVWTDPRRVKIIASTIRDALTELDPAHGDEYQTNYGQFATDLEQLDSEIRALLGEKKERRFMVFHPAWGYFAEAYGLHQIPIETAGKEPGAKQLARVIDEAKAKGIRVIFVQAQFSRRNAETVARAIGGRVIAVDPLAENYLENLRLVAQTFAKAMQ